MDVERGVANHYSRSGLEEAILEALRAAGKDVDNLTAEDLSGADEFHLGWRAATVEFAKELGLASGMHVLDVGSGIGGPARYFAEAHRCRVTGVDLTEDFVQAASALTRRCGLAESVAFRQASALALPFQAETFDAATLIHVGMNIADKARLFSEVRRVLRPEARFGVYDIMRVGEGEIPFPMPWAATAETSFVEPVDVYRRLLAEAGFRIEKEQSRRDMSLQLGREMREKAAASGAPPVGLHLLMGPATEERLANVMSTLQRGTIAPVEVIARKF